MRKETYCLPTSPTDCFDFQRNAIDLCSANAANWNIPETKITDLNTLRADYEPKFIVTNNKNTQSPSATVARNAAWALLKFAITDLYNGSLLHNEAIDEETKKCLNIKFTSSGRGVPTPTPTTTPIVSLIADEISTLKVVYSDSGSTSTRSKPMGVAFCELCYGIDGELPKSPNDCPQRVNISRSGETIIFQPDQRGKTVAGFARWVTKSGKFGPWSALFSAIVP